MDADDRDAEAPWSRGRQLVAVVGWSSFLSACLGTLLLFAAVDPLWVIDHLLASGFGGHGVLTPSGIYSLGFFLFWLIGVSAAGLTAWLLATRAP